jgi:ankyrin repeat protein
MIHRVSLIASFIAFSILSGCGAGIFTPSHHVTEQYNAAVAAASSGDLVTLQAHVDNDRALLQVTEWDGRTLLHDAVDKSQLEVTKYLLDRGANIEAVTADGRTVLHMAAQHGDIPMISLLLGRGAIVNPIDNEGWTPLDRATKWEHPNAVDYLRKHGAHEGNRHQ